MTIADRLGNRDNSFDFVRALAASLVIFGHSYALAGFPNDPSKWLTGESWVSKLAVHLFFVLSGFLITKSWCEEPRLSAYAFKRGARIVPAMAAATLGAALLLGPLVTGLPLGQYFRSRTTWSYVYSNLTLVRMQYLLPGVFADLPFPYAVNGSLWTLTVEVYLYLAVPLLAGLASLWRRNLKIGLALLAGGLIAWDWFDLSRPERASLVVFWLLVRSTTACAVYFVLGALLYHYRKQVPLRWDLFLLALGVLVASWHTPYAEVVSYLALPYIALYIGLTSNPVARWFSRWGDPSYGLYVYAFPIQQTLVYLYRDIRPEVLFVLSLLVTAVIAYASWHLLEKRVLGWMRAFLKRQRQTQPVPVAIGVADQAA